VSALRALGMPVLTWTVRTEQQREKAKAYADAIIFEELAP
jgi:glycerophosphoryl diester phosphodiesterase